MVITVECHPKSSDYVKFGVPFIMASDLSNGSVDFGTCSFISAYQASQLQKGFAKTGDVLLSHKATIGRTAIVQESEFDFIVLTPQITYYRIKNGLKLNNQYLKGYFDSSFFQGILGSWAGSGSTRAYLGITAQLKLPIIVPPIERQYAIAKQVFSINKKIELNRQTNQTLEQIAQALFKSWFVDFEPTRAKIAAKEAGASPEEIERAAMCAISGKTPDQLAQLPPATQQNLKTTAVLFPDALVDSELGEIPEGWEIKAMGHYLDTISKTYPLKTVDKVIFLNTGDIQNGQFLHAEYSEASSLPGQAKKSIQKNDILYSEIRPENKRFAFVNFDAPHHVVSTKLMVLRATKDIFSLFLYFILTQKSTVDHLQMLAESRSGTFPQITFDHLSRIEFI